jgi:hypothetical protein
MSRRPSNDMCPVSLNVARAHGAELGRARLSETGWRLLSHSIWSVAHFVSPDPVRKSRLPSTMLSELLLHRRLMRRSGEPCGDMPGMPG